MNPDALILAADSALRTLWAEPRASRSSPTPATAGTPLSDAEKRASAALMRVNHVGEVCAQALYTGQMLASQNPVLRGKLLEACREETGKLGGDRLSLGFVVETENQVEAHLNSHMERLPAADTASRAIVAQMKDDEVQHARMAEREGALPLPGPVKSVMAMAAKVMTTVAHRI